MNAEVLVLAATMKAALVVLCETYLLNRLRNIAIHVAIHLAPETLAGAVAFHSAHPANWELEQILHSSIVSYRQTIHETGGEYQRLHPTKHAR